MTPPTGFVNRSVQTDGPAEIQHVIAGQSSDWRDSTSQ